MKPPLGAGRRRIAALRGGSPAVTCPQCEPLSRENEALLQELAELRKRAAAHKDENARLREGFQEAHRAAKRQAAPFSKGSSEGRSEASRSQARQGLRGEGSKADPRPL